MVGRVIELSRESERQILIQNLNNYGVFESRKGETLEKLNYHALVGLLAIEEVVRE